MIDVSYETHLIKTYVVDSEMKPPANSGVASIGSDEQIVFKFVDEVHSSKVSYAGKNEHFFLIFI